MKELVRSLCSTCRHVAYCSLSTDRTNIQLCNEYVHRLDEGDGPAIMVTNEMINIKKI